MPMCPAVWSGMMRVFWMLTEPKSIMKPWGDSSLTGRTRTGACTKMSPSNAVYLLLKYRQFHFCQYLRNILLTESM